MNKKVIIFFFFIIVFYGKVTWATIFDESIYRIENKTKDGIMSGTGFAVEYDNKNFILTTENYSTPFI